MYTFLPTTPFAPSSQVFNFVSLYFKKFYPVIKNKHWVWMEYFVYIFFMETKQLIKTYERA
jgi:hypothetical protein